MADSESRSITTIDEYIAGYPPEIQKIMQEIRSIIRAAAPEAKEKISWQMATFDFYGNLVHFAAHKSHIGFYPGASGIEHFQHLFGDYKFSKGAVQFPFSQPLPKDLIEQIVRFRLAENIELAEEKRLRKKKK